MRWLKELGLVAAGVVIALGTLKFTTHQTLSSSESAYDRVLRTGEIRCGYGLWPKVFVKDPTTGTFTGIVPDVAQALGDKLHLKIIWAEETGWGSFIESLKTHRIDVMCASIWRNAERGRYVSFVEPIFYNAIYAYASPSDHRFDKDLDLVNDPSVRLSTMDGEMSDVIAKERFPKATKISVAQLGQASDILMNVAAHKADITFTSSDSAAAFLKANPGAIRLVQEEPFRIFPASFAVDIHEHELRDMIDSAMVELHNEGIIEDILRKNDADPTQYLRRTKPFQ